LRSVSLMIAAQFSILCVLCALINNAVMVFGLEGLSTFFAIVSMGHHFATREYVGGLQS
jgi:hypothetical protein